MADVHDPIDHRLRTIGRAARAEAVAELDIETALAQLHALPTHGFTHDIGPGAPESRRPAVWLAAAAAVIVAVAAGVLLFGSGDRQVRTSEPTPDPTSAPAPSSAPDSRAPTTTAPAATEPGVVDTDPTTTTTDPATTTPVTSELTTVADWRTLEWEPSGIPIPCAECTQLVTGPDGVPVTHDRDARILTRHDATVVSVAVPESYGQVYVNPRTPAARSAAGRMSSTARAIRSSWRRPTGSSS